ncbi:hypothetical protein H5410_001849 [Solanum commersonii]|uniref:Uncharacterized protein n=1 Tax=Solanum commersonii TaxID=4109 RepID=A0A9J6B0C7_SOLCO|nr:hypothetical protein H5410_001849 [Solanum commersonii]
MKISKSPIDRIFTFCSSALSPEGRSESVVKKSVGVSLSYSAKLKDGSPNPSAIPTNVAERSFGAHFLKTINTSPMSIHSTRESEWVKAEVVLHAASGCPRGTHLKQGKFLERELIPPKLFLAYKAPFDT